MASAKVSPPENTRGFFDPITVRHKVLSNVKEAYEDRLNRLESNNFKLKVSDLKYPDPNQVFSIQEQKNAILEKKDLSVPLRAKIELINKKDGGVIDSKETVLARVPWVTERNTTIMHGVESISLIQSLLKSGVYCRRAKSGLIEGQINVEPGSGIGGKVIFSPDNQQFHYQIANSKFHLYSLLHDFGIQDKTIADEWGKDLLDRNRKNYNPNEIEKLHSKLFEKYK